MEVGNRDLVVSAAREMVDSSTFLLVAFSGGR